MKPLTEEERLQGRTQLEILEECFLHTKRIWKEAKELEKLKDDRPLRDLLWKWNFTDIYAIEKWGEWEREKIRRLNEAEEEK